MTTRRRRRPATWRLHRRFRAKPRLLQRPRTYRAGLWVHSGCHICKIGGRHIQTRGRLNVGPMPVPRDALNKLNTLMLFYNEGNNTTRWHACTHARREVINSTATTPTEKTSLAKVICPDRAYSGSMYPGVPNIRVVWPVACSMSGQSLAKPKSPREPRNVPSIRIFADLMSRCTMGGSTIVCRYSSPEAASSSRQSRRCHVSIDRPSVVSSMLRSDPRSLKTYTMHGDGPSEEKPTSGSRFS